LRHGLKLAFAGFLAGAAAAIGLTRLIAGLLFGVSAHDPITLAVVGSILLGVAFLASYAPARWATRVDPMVAFRSE